jgi:large-conductance mechanosensitive channel
MNTTKEMDEKEDILTTNPKTNAIISLVMIILASILFVGYVIYSGWYTNDSIIRRVKNFYGSSLSNLSLGLIIVILGSEVVNSFNTYIMKPIVRSAFPGGGWWDSCVKLKGKGAIGGYIPECNPLVTNCDNWDPNPNYMCAGQFIQTSVSFVLSIGLVFVMLEFSNWIRSKTSSNISKGVKGVKGKGVKGVKGKKQGQKFSIFVKGGILLTVILFVYLIYWNVKDLLEIINKPETESRSFSPRKLVV